MEEKIVYQHAFSVGDGCNVAAALSRTGLREHSGPFDWVISDIEDVMTLIENHFEDFLNPEMLVPSPIPFNAGQRRHTRYKSIIFVHDFAPEEDAPPLEEQIGAIQEKYARRIAYFYECLKEPTMFYHFVFGGDMEYWKTNAKRVERFFKQIHPDNLFVLMAENGQKAGQTEEIDGVPIYYVQGQKDDHVLGYYADTNPQLKALMHSPENFPLARRAENLRFFIDKQLGINREISMNEMRIARDKLAAEQTIWKEWVKLLQNGKRLADRILQEGGKTVGIFGYNDFFEPVVGELKAAGLEVKFVTSWYLREKEECLGIPVFNPHDPSEEEIAKQEQESQDQTEEDEDKHWLAFFARQPIFATVDAMVLVDVEDDFFIKKGKGLFPCKIYSLKNLLGIE